MRDLEVVIYETTQYVRHYRVDDDFDADDLGAVGQLVLDDDDFRDGMTGYEEVTKVKVTADIPIRENSRSNARKIWRETFSSQLEYLRRRFGDADVIDDRRGGDALAAPYGDGMLFLRNAQLSPGAPPGWSGWYEDADGEPIASVTEVNSEYNAFEQAVNLLLHAALETRPNDYPQGWHENV